MLDSYISPDKYRLVIIITILITLIIVKVIQMYKKKKKIDMQHGSVIEGLTKIVLDRGNDTAFIDIRDSVLSGVATPEAYIVLAAMYLKKNDNIKALHLYESLILKKQLNDKDTSFAMQLIYHTYRKIVNLTFNNETNQQDELNKILSRINITLESLKDIKDNTYFIMLTALSLLHQNNFAEARKELYKVQKEKSLPTPINILLSETYYYEGKLESFTNKKLKLYKNAISINKNARQVYYSILDIYLAADKISAAYELATLIINKGFIRNKDDMDKIHELYLKDAKIETLYEIIEHKVHAEVANIGEYLFLYGYYLKKGKKLQGEELLRSYLSKNYSDLLLKEYIRFKNDDILIQHNNIKNIYECNYCRNKSWSFTYTCKHCGNTDTLEYS